MRPGASSKLRRPPAALPPSTFKAPMREGQDVPRGSRRRTRGADRRNPAASPGCTKAVAQSCSPSQRGSKAHQCFGQSSSRTVEVALPSSVLLGDRPPKLRSLTMPLAVTRDLTQPCLSNAHTQDGPEKATARVPLILNTGDPRPSRTKVSAGDCTVCCKVTEGVACTRRASLAASTRSFAHSSPAPARPNNCGANRCVNDTTPERRALPTEAAQATALAAKSEALCAMQHSVQGSSPEASDNNRYMPKAVLDAIASWGHEMDGTPTLSASSTVV
mmetsp:Transcript_67315/g.219269  ORF Transcript_67315/g.219269 Transcript_67315/m.219269 type:complete len:275 (-) Transcript_67315:62-886(-)